MARKSLVIFSAQPDEVTNERIAWLQEWLKEIYGGTLPQPHRGNSSVDTLDDLVAQLDNASLDQIKATMSDDIQAKVHIDGMNEHELKSLVVSAAEMSTLITGTGKMSIAPCADNDPQVVDEDMEMADAEDEPMSEDLPAAAPTGATIAHISGDWSDWEEHGDANDNPRCWTRGTPICICREVARASVRAPGTENQLGWNAVDIACDLDCPPGKSVAEMRGLWREYSPCCGELDCVCRDRDRDSSWL